MTIDTMPPFSDILPPPPPFFCSHSHPFPPSTSLPLFPFPPGWLNPLTEAGLWCGCLQRLPAGDWGDFAASAGLPLFPAHPEQRRHLRLEPRIQRHPRHAGRAGESGRPSHRTPLLQRRQPGKREGKGGASTKLAAWCHRTSRFAQRLAGFRLWFLPGCVRVRLWGIHFSHLSNCSNMTMKEVTNGTFPLWVEARLHP